MNLAQRITAMAAVLMILGPAIHTLAAEKPNVVLIFSQRDSVVVYVGNDIFGVKWRNWKMMTKEIERGAGEAIKTFPVPAFYNLHLDPREENPTLYTPDNLWVRYPASEVLMEHAKSLRVEPPVPPGTPDPYVPANK